MATSYLSSHLSSFPPKQLLSVAQAIGCSQCRVTSFVLQGKVAVAKEANDVGKAISEMQQLSVSENDDFQQRLLDRTLKEKELLESRLHTLDSTLQLLRTPEPEELKTKVRFSAVRRDLSAEQVRKREDSREFVRTIRQRKKAEFETAYQQIQREIQDRISKAEAVEQQREADYQRKLAAFHDSQLSKFHHKVAQHKAASPLPSPTKLPKRPSNPRLRSSSPPSLASPQSKEKLNIGELKAHEKKYVMQRQELEEKRARQTAERQAEMRLLEATLDLTPPHTPEPEKRAEYIRSLRERRYRYGLIVREVFKPEIDLQKKSAREELIASMLKPKSRKPSKEHSQQRKSDSGIHRWTGWHGSPEQGTEGRKDKPRKLKSLSPEPERVVRYKDYLKTMVRQREEMAMSELSGGLGGSWEVKEMEECEGQASAIRAEAKRLVAKVKRQEAALKLLPVTHPKALDAQASVSSAMISAVKAKLALFQSSVSPAVLK